MINQEAVQAVAQAHFSGRFVRPLYDSYCFARVPHTIESLLTGAATPGLPPAALAGLPERCETVILIFLDAFGWRFFEPRAERYPFLKRFLDDGVVSPLTTMFPSTTAAHVTTLNTGLPPAASGVFEWFSYEPQLDAIIAPLLFSFAGDHGRETLSSVGARPADLLPRGTLYDRLSMAGVRSTIIQHRDYAGSSFTRTVCAGADVVPFRTMPEALTLLSQRLTNRPGPAYYYLYVDTIDAVSHVYGPDSAHVDAEIDTVLTSLDRLLHPALQAAHGDVALLLVADHGQIGVDPETTIALNKVFPGLAHATRTSADGAPLVPAGSRRDMFLYIRDERLAEVHAGLTRALDGRAEVHRTADMIAAGMFGGDPSPSFLGRVGNLVVLPYAGESVWWEFAERGRFESTYRGSHGGLTRDEAVTQLAALYYGG
ncbi:alkaline phosphatase family protein [Oscillochloris sp. ZM17-4]|uniref:alkaline phosphatase family protein n=1 Tax=Oscillochloris sp. ZM17-4 TaxID=2866714 RepID=UPI001C73A7F4|nr:alkaline phosphatase family protein [Oscillochloris sp. ZM17-4]MBX0326627.1 alkaline phosphatase family protein [Oscillochloris sp. ZM17-4]